MIRALPLLLLLAACTNATGDSPSPEASGGTEGTEGFDALAWLAEAREVRFDPENSEPGSPETLRAKALAAELDEAVGWKRACDTYIDPETGAAVYEPLADDEAIWVRGTLDIGMRSETEAIVAVTCDFGAYQGSYALVRISNDRATLLRAPATDENGEPMDASETSFATPVWDRLQEGIVNTLGLARGIGDCGSFITYTLASGDEMELTEVRMRVCGEDIPDPLPPFEEWPVAYVAE